VFNKGALMLLPGGITKGTGLLSALAAMELSPHNVVGVGDGENDHAFLGLCEFAVAVADAVPALRARADHVTAEPASEGVIRLVEEHVLDDARMLAARIARHQLVLGDEGDGTRVTLSPHLGRLLIVGPSGTGTSSLTGLLVEQLVEQGRSLCVIDPEGDHRSLGDLEGVVVLGGGAHGLPAREELGRLLRRPAAGVVLDLAAMSRAEKVGYATEVLAAVAEARGATGLPHWLVVDEAHHLFPAEGSPASELLRRTRDPVCLITLTLDGLARELRDMPTALASPDLAVFNATLAALAATRGEARVGALHGPPLEPGDAAFARLDRGPTQGRRFRMARRRVDHRRHLRKHVEGEP
jgi:hypothetical protein